MVKQPQYLVVVDGSVFASHDAPPKPTDILREERIYRNNHQHLQVITREAGVVFNFMFRKWMGTGRRMSTLF